MSSEVKSVRRLTMEFSGLAIKNGNSLQALYEKSTGYRALLSMIMELAYRSVLLNPDINDEADQTGIVIIDEIDAHLHPKWQWRVIDALKKCFPKVQFIIATHSPIVISSAKNTKLIRLDPDGSASYLETAYGYSVADVLDLRQGSVSAPEVSSDFMDRLERAIDHGDMSEADSILSEAGDEFGEDSPIYTELNDYMKVNRWVENN